MTDTPTRLPTHDRMWIEASDIRVKDTIPCVGEVMHVDITADAVRMQLKHAVSQSYELAPDTCLWVDRWVIR